MFLEIISLLVLVIVLVSPFLIVWYISSNLKRARDLDRVRQDRAFKRLDGLARETARFSKNISDCQGSLYRQIHLLNESIEAHQLSMTTEYNELHEFSKSDMLAARREELLRTKELKVALERLMGVALTSRQPPSPNDVLALENLDSRINELKEILRSDQ